MISIFLLLSIANFYYSILSQGLEGFKEISLRLGDFSASRAIGRFGKKICLQMKIMVLLTNNFPHLWEYLKSEVKALKKFEAACQSIRHEKTFPD
jgi:hypothetical protein